MTPFLSTDDLKLWRLEDGSLVMKHGGRKTLLASPRRALPLSNPDEFIVFSDLDGNEIGILRAVRDLVPASQEILEEALSREYVLHHITRIWEVDKEPLTGQTRWRVELEGEPTGASEETDQNAIQSTLNGTEEGETEVKTPRPTVSKMANLLNFNRDKERMEEARSANEHEFHINGQEDVQTARYPHIFLVDTERNRYEILNCEELDLESRRLAERFF